MRFLYDQSQRKLDDKAINRWYSFSEVKQTWLGYSQSGNMGRGLAGDFAKAIYNNLYKFFPKSRAERVTESIHIEKLYLFERGVGRDRISDFATNLIKGFIAKYTENFARAHIDERLCRLEFVDRTRFDYRHRDWIGKKYYLPIYNNDYVFLVPKDILTKDDTWINPSDFEKNFFLIIDSLPNEDLRKELNEYFRSAITPSGETVSSEDLAQAAAKTIDAHPVIYDYYIKFKEHTGEYALEKSIHNLAYSETLFITQFKKLVMLLLNDTDFYDIDGSSHDGIIRRFQTLKTAIEEKGGYRYLRTKTEHVRYNYDDFRVLFEYVWYGGMTNPLERYFEDKDKIRFIYSTHRQLDTVIRKTLNSNEHASDADKRYLVIFYFSQDEIASLFKRLERLIETDEIIYIDVSTENKTIRITQEELQELNDSHQKIISDKSIHIVVQSALSQEINAFRDIFKKKYSELPLKTLKGRDIYKYVLPEGLEVIASSANGTGEGETIMLTAELIEEYDPKKFILIGIAGGKEGSVNIGDIVVAKKIKGYSTMVISPEGTISNTPYGYTCDSYLREVFSAYRTKEWVNEILVDPPVESDNNMHYGDIISGNVHTKSKLLTDSLYLSNEGAIAIEMESTGVAKATKKYTGRYKFITSKAISDYGIEEPEAAYRRYVMEVAAAYVSHILSNLIDKDKL